MSNLPAMILAAGRGERMRPLTDKTPKPLLRVRGKRLIEWHLEALARGGVEDVVINAAWLGDQLPEALGDGSRWGLRIRYSMEAADHGGALETAGGIAKALPLLGQRFWIVAGDVFVPEFHFAKEAADRFCRTDALAHLWMVPNPDHNPRGDFALDRSGMVRNEGDVRWTYSTIALVDAGLVKSVRPGEKAALRPYLDAAIQEGRISAETYNGTWVDVGTPERLAFLNEGR